MASNSRVGGRTLFAGHSLHSAKPSATTTVLYMMELHEIVADLARISPRLHAYEPQDPTWQQVLEFAPLVAACVAGVSGY
jgi:hypothetical protein